MPHTATTPMNIISWVLAHDQPAALSLSATISQYFIGGMMPELANPVQQRVDDYRNPAVFGILILSWGGSGVQAPLSPSVDKSLNSSIVSIKDTRGAASRRQKSARPPRASAPELVS